MKHAQGLGLVGIGTMLVVTGIAAAQVTAKKPGAVGTAPTVAPSPAPTPVLPPRILAFRRVQAPTTTGPTTQQAAQQAQLSAAILKFEVDIANAAPLSHLRVGWPHGDVKIDTTSTGVTTVSFWRAESELDGCPPVRFDLALIRKDSSAPNDLVARTAVLTPSCTFTFNTEAEAISPMDMFPTIVESASLTATPTCGKPWPGHTRVLNRAGETDMAGSLLARPLDTLILGERYEPWLRAIPVGPAPLNLGFKDEFRGTPGVFRAYHLAKFKRHESMIHAAHAGLKVTVRRTCTWDAGRLE
jgi:hypothetical protein